MRAPEAANSGAIGVMASMRLPCAEAGPDASQALLAKQTHRAIRSLRRAVQVRSTVP